MKSLKLTLVFASLALVLAFAVNASAANTVDTQITQGAVFQAHQSLTRQTTQVRQLRLGQAQLGAPGAHDMADFDQVHGWWRI